MKRDPKKIKDVMQKHLIEGKTFKIAAIEGGLPQVPSLANLKGTVVGLSIFNDVVRDIREFGSRYDANARAELVRGRLIQNVAEGKDSAVQSLKLMGQDREVNMFVPENSTNILTMPVPRGWEQSFSMEKTIDVPTEIIVDSMTEG